MSMWDSILENPLFQKFIAKKGRELQQRTGAHGIYVYFDGDKLKYTEYPTDPAQTISELEAEIDNLKNELLNELR